MIARLVRKLMNADALGIMLVIAALATFTYGVSSSLPDTDSSSFFWICLAAATISFGLGRSRWNGMQASVGIVALGILFVWILGARLTRPLFDLLNASVSIIPHIVPSIQSKTAIDTTAVLEAWTVIAEATSALMGRLQTWFLGFNRSVTINDVLVRNMVWALIFWLCSAWMGWFTEKRNAVVSLLPAMVLLSAVTSYSEYRIESIWVMTLLLLFLMGLWNYRNHHLQWLKRGIDYSESIRIDSTQAVLFLTIAIGTFAFLTPSITWHEVIDYFRERQNNNETAEMLGIQQPRGSDGASSVQKPSLPRDHLLSGGFANPEHLVMTIRTGELPPVASESLAVTAPHYYWRSTVYDRYVGTGWITSTVFTQTIPADTPLIPGLLSGYRLVHMDVRMVEPEGRLFWSGTLFSADIPFTVDWRVRPPSDLFADQAALLQTDMFAASSPATAYRLETYVPIPSIHALRSASTDYPEDIRLRYLPLPSSVPERVHELASEITDGLSNPYEKAKAIEAHLRMNYPYTLDVPPPPEGRDVADFFLFDLKKGYCDYYATAMVVLARSSGLPARFVSGYSSGSYDAPNAQYIVRELNAHSWAEIYFPGIGWVEFEPTASMPEIEHTAGPAVLPASTGSEETASKMLTRFRVERILLWSSPLIVLLLSLLFYFAFVERWLVIRLNPQAALDAIYQRFYRAGRPLAGAWTRAETSTEFLNKFTANIRTIQRHTRLKKLPAELNTNAIALTDLYHSSLFIEHQTQRRDAVTAWQVWKSLRRQLFFMKVIQRITGASTTLRANDASS